MKNIDKHFVSEIDKKMAEFDARHSKSASQQSEIEKYRKIHHMRDVPTDHPEKKEDLWD